METEQKDNKEKGIVERILEGEDPRTGKPWYVRYKHVLMLVGFWLLFGFICFLLDR